jgi:hypothetical protein
MRMRSHRRSLMVWSPPGGPADRHGSLAFTRRARPRPIRWWLRTGALLTVIGITRTARAMRARWRSVFTVTGGLLVVIGFMLPNGGAVVAGLIVVLFALLRGAERSHCRAAAQMSAARWHG